MIIDGTAKITFSLQTGKSSSTGLGPSNYLIPERRKIHLDSVTAGIDPWLLE